MKYLMLFIVSFLSIAAYAQERTWQPRESWVTEHLRRNRGSYRAITGRIRPANWREGASFDKLADKVKKWEGRPLPDKWDWREQAPNGLQPIRNQKNCGSCWAFSVTAVVESLIRIKMPEFNPDLSEQTLVSSCESGGSCSGGYFGAFNYIRNPGLPDEKQDPYLARNSSCKSGLIPIAKIARWSYITGPNGGEPTIEQLKIATMEYGPISVGVNGSFGSYGHGVFNSCGSMSENHMMDIEGWVDDPVYDANGGGYWIVRNSWGADWGEQGYLRIVYKSRNGGKCNGIGREAAYAVLN